MSETIARFGIAGVAGCGASCCVHPLDVVRINLQIDQAGARVYKGTFDCLSQIFKKEGVSGLYAGLSAGMLRQITYGMPRMAFVPILYDQVRDPSEVTLPLYKKLFCGAVAGGTDTEGDFSFGMNEILLGVMYSAEFTNKALLKDAFFKRTTKVLDLIKNWSQTC